MISRIFSLAKTAGTALANALGVKAKDAAEKKVMELVGKAGGEKQKTAKEKKRVVSKFFTTSDGRFNVIYFWATAFLAQTWAIVAAKLAIVGVAMYHMIKNKVMDFGVLGELVSDTLILGLLTFVTTFIFVYNKHKKDTMDQGGGNGE